MWINLDGKQSFFSCALLLYFLAIISVHVSVLGFNLPGICKIMSEWESIVGSKKASSYGTCVRSAKQTTTQYVKHYLDKSDTLPGLALKYDCSPDELRRINKLYSSDSIFLRQYLHVPAPKIFPLSDPENAGIPQIVEKAEEPPAEEMDAFSFLKQLDSKITAGKNAVKDLKFDDDIISADPQGSARYFPTSHVLKSNSNKKSKFSHSQTMESNNLFQL